MGGLLKEKEIVGCRFGRCDGSFCAYERLSGMAEGHSGKLAVVGKWHAPNRLEANQREVVPF